MQKTREFSEKLFEMIRSGKVKDKSGLEKVKNQIGKELGMNRVPTNPDILEFADDGEIKEFSKILNLKPTRSISGVSVITVVAKPADCPGECIYCPRGSNSPQSYTGMEPAVQRGIRNDYDPHSQTKDRLNQLKIMGHSSDKIEVIILGGTFLALDKSYQEWFVKRIFDALNGKESENLEDAQKLNETGKHRCIGLTVETRADYCFEDHIDQILKLGGTRVEIGAQSVYPEILKKVKRGHDVDDIIKATKLVKNSGLKCTYHIMPGLFSSFEEDLEQFKILFEDGDFKPDSLKIYPALVIEDTKLHDLWKKGGYKPLETEEAVELISEGMRHVPKYCRVIRVQRDIPSDKIIAGVKKSNLRELVERECEKKKVRIKDIRYREVGHKMKKGLAPDQSKIKLLRTDYEASGGKEIFLSFEDTENDVLFGFLRLRIPDGSFRPEIDEKSALIRELHVYGTSVPIGEAEMEHWQHKGFGKKLLKEAERISQEEFGMKKVVVISGIGVREYYRKFGYKRDGAYMSKSLGHT